MFRLRFFQVCGRWASLLIVVAALGCGDPSGPSYAEQVWVLERVGSDALPAVLSGDETYRLRVLADTLRLNLDGRGMRTGLHDYEPLDGGDGTREEIRVSRELTYEMVSGFINIAFTCGPAELCIAPPHFVGRVENGRLLIDYAVDGRVPLIYRAID